MNSFSPRYTTTAQDLSEFILKRGFEKQKLKDELKTFVNAYNIYDSPLWSKDFTPLERLAATQFAFVDHKYIRDNPNTLKHISKFTPVGSHRCIEDAISNVVPKDTKRLKELLNYVILANKLSHYSDVTDMCLHKDIRDLISRFNSFFNEFDVNFQKFYDSKNGLVVYDKSFDNINML